MARTRRRPGCRSQTSAARRARATYQERKTIPCSQCSLTFSCIYNRDQHMRSKHTGERPFNCACGKSYARRWLLLRHQRTAHPDEVDDEEGRSELEASSSDISAMSQYAESRQGDIETDESDSLDISHPPMTFDDEMRNVAAPPSGLPSNPLPLETVIGMVNKWDATDDEKAGIIRGIKRARATEGGMHKNGISAMEIRMSAPARIHLCEECDLLFETLGDIVDHHHSVHEVEATMAYGSMSGRRVSGLSSVVPMEPEAMYHATR